MSTASAKPAVTTLVSFDGSDGSQPLASLIVNAAGDLLGTTDAGGAYGFGTVFEIGKTSAGYASTPTTLVTFNGCSPFKAGLITDAAGDLFGTTTIAVFEIARTSTGYAGSPTTVVTFNGSNGSEPLDGLVADSAGNLFGTTDKGGANGDGTVFEIPKSATGHATAPTTLVSFNGSNGDAPETPLIIDAAGDIFGVTDYGGANDDGTVFEIAKTSTGYARTPATLISFNGTDGSLPYAALVTDATGDLFGTTLDGGANGDGTVFEIAKTSTGYASTPTILVSFNGTDGSSPGGLIVDADGDLFGTTSGGGTNSDGTAFEIAKTSGVYASAPTTLISFNGSNGSSPVNDGLIADANGNLYGTTEEGGAASQGTVFEITNSGFVVPIPPVVTLATAPAAANGQAATLATVKPGIGTDALSVVLTSDTDFVTGSTLALVNGSLVYTPGLITAAKAGSDTLKYTVTDSVTGATTTETQTVTLSNGPAPLVTFANAPAASSTASATLGTAVPGMGSDALSVALTSDADFASGSTLVLSNGTLVYTPGVITAAKAGSDTLKYTVTDTVTGAVTTETQTVTLSGPATTTYIWKSAVSADWNVAADWSPAGPPNAPTADAAIGVAGNYTVTIAAGETVSVDSLTFNPGTGGVLALNGSLTLGGTRAAMAVASGTVNVAGSINGSNVSLTSAAGAALNLTTDGTEISSTGTFSNAGTLAKTGGSGTSTIDAAVNNTGSIVANSGTLLLYGGGTLGGTIGGGAGAVILDGSFNLAPGQTTSVLFGAGASLATLQQGCFLSGAGTLASSGTVGIYDRVGATALAPQVTVTGGATWSNSGVVNDGGVITLGNGTATDTSKIVNQGVMDLITNDSQILANSAKLGTLSFANAGLLEKTAGTGTSDFSGITLTNTGTITSTSGTLELDSLGTLNGTIGGTGSGLLQFGNGANYVTIGTAAVPDAGSNDGLRLANGAIWTVSGTISDSGRLELGNGSGTSTLAIATGASFDFTTDDGSIVNGTGAILTNAGTIAKTGGTGISTIGIGFTNSGTVEAASGTLKLAGTLAGSGSLQIEAGETLELGSGAVAGSNTIDFNGTGATLKIDTNSTVTKPIQGLGVGSRIDLAMASSATAAINGNTLTVTPLGGTALNFVSAASLAGLTVSTGSDGASGTVVTISGPTYTLTPMPTTILATLGGDTFIATDGALNSRDGLTGGPGGIDTLVLSGGGVFDLGAPKTLANIEVVDASEGQAAYTKDATSIPATSQTVLLRDGLNVALNVASSTPNPSNPNPAGITIFGGADASVINLGTGSDTVVLGSVTETVNANAGGGTALVQATAAQAGALVAGTANAATTLEITSGGTAALNADTTRLTVKLDLATNLVLGKLGFITAVGEAAGNTITAGAANQTLSGLAGGDTLVGYSGFGDTFQGTAAGLNGDTIKAFGGSDVIDFTDIAFGTLKPLSYTALTGKLVASDATHSATVTLTGSYTAASFSAVTDGHGGTLIKWV